MQDCVGCFLPKKVCKADLVVGPQRPKDLMPPKALLDKQPSDRALQFARDWVYFTLRDLVLIPHDGVDHQCALRHMLALARTCDMPSGQKVHIIAVLVDEWFRTIVWEVE